MKKFTDFLEKNSQWLAMALGGFWLLFMVYSHILASSTASVDVKGNALGPGSVDQFIEDNAIAKLKDAMAGTGTLKGLTVKYPEMVDAQIKLSGENAVTLAGPGFKGMGPNLPGPDKNGGPNLPRPNAQVLANGIPQAPPLVNVDVVVGKSIVTPQTPAVGGIQGPVQARQLWATVFGTVPMADLQKEYAAKNINNLNFPPAQQTMFLKVEIIRTELLTNGAFGNPVTIVSQPINLNAALPAVPVPAWPDKQPQPELAYREWAATNQSPICQPAFFTVVKGDGWHIPTDAPFLVGVVAPPPQPLPPPTPTPTPTNPRRQITPPTPTPRQPVIPRPQTGRQPSGMGSIDNPGQTTANMLQVFTDNPPQSMPPGGFGGPGAQPTAPATPANAPGAPPAGRFAPSNAADVNLWVHDTTVQSGKTYQYQMRYTLYNPLFMVQNVVPQGQNWAQVFSVDSPWVSAPKPVQIPDTTSYYVAGVLYRNSDTNVKFDIYVWDVGGVAKNTVSVSPGDQLDPKLPLTLVDARKNGIDDNIVILMDDSGNLFYRSSRADQKNPANLALQAEILAQKPAGP